MNNYNDYLINKYDLITYNRECNDYLDNIVRTDDDYLFKLSIISRIPVFDYSIKLDCLYTNLSTELMDQYGVLLYVDKDDIIGIMYDPIKNFNYDVLLVGITRNIKLFLINEDDFNKYKEIARLSSVEKHYETFEINKETKVEEEVSFHYTEVTSSPVVMMVNHWLEKAIVLGASDIHFEPSNDQGKIRIRLDGKLKIMDYINMDSYDEVVTRIKVISNLDIAKKLEPQDGKCVLKIKKVSYDLRISTLPTILGEKIVVRILSKENLKLQFKKLNYLPEEEDLIRDLLKEKSGIILITGPTGCGKTSTLYTYLNELICEENNIVTVEDPVEYTIEGINQIQVNNNSGLTFSKALRSILRQDPNIIMIGEIRDEETAQIACRAAISGHLVLSTLHTNSSIDAITRLLDMGIPRYLVTSALRAVISQRLVRRLCPICKKKFVPSNEINKKFHLTKGTILFNKGGCENCYYTGYKGRMLLSEILIVDDNFKELISNLATTKKLENYARKNGMIFLEEKYQAAVMSGNTTIEEKMH